MRKYRAPITAVMARVHHASRFIVNAYSWVEVIARSSRGWSTVRSIAPVLKSLGDASKRGVINAQSHPARGQKQARTALQGVPSVTNSQHFLFDHLASAGAISLPEASASAESSGCRRFGHRSRRAIGPVSTLE